MPKPSTVGDALLSATSFWEANERHNSRGSNMMPIRARVCSDILGRSRKLSTLNASDGAQNAASEASALCTGLTDAGLEHLKELTQLESLELNGDGVSERAVSELRKALPSSQITIFSCVTNL